MKRVSTFELVPGMILAEDVMSYDMQVILSKDTELTDTLITRLELYGILTVHIQDASYRAPAPELDMSSLFDDEDTAQDEDIQDDELPIPEPVLNAKGVAFAPMKPTFADRVVASREYKIFKKNFESASTELKTVLNDMVERNSPLNTTQLLEHPLKLVAGVGSRLGVMDILHNLRGYDDSTFAHSINVALLNYLSAGWLGWSQEEQELAMTCGLLHDVGKLKVDYDVLNKPDKLDNGEMKHIQRHSVYGYEILKSQDVDDHVKYSALMHHERYDGTGYPMHLESGKIDRYAALTAVSDVYDAMTAARVYRGPQCPFRVIEIFEQDGFAKYDAEILMTFLKNVGNTYVRNACLLNDGREGEIIMLNSEKLSRPLVQCGWDYVDLAEHPSLRIERLL